ncbi:MAG: DNA adenine methylase [Anaerolineae bacterium]|nr:DNA adenine methylase [Anaerolineae bacterium]
MSVDPQDVLVSQSAKPFLKWAGGKQQLLTQFELFFPPTIGRYFEPFVGGGAVFFHLVSSRRLPGPVFLFDKNEELINAYRVVRDRVDELIEALAVHKVSHSKEHYYQTRSLDRQDGRLNDRVVRAARTLYLNKTCYNGLYRVNSKGQFNVPMGSYRNPQILNENVLRDASAALQGADIQVRDFREVIDLAQADDFFYFDPPYDPLSKTASFTGYTANDFGEQDQRDLAGIFKQLTEKGCRCMLSNSSTDFVCDLYAGFRLEKVQARRAVNSDKNGRGDIEEVVVLNY